MKLHLQGLHGMDHMHMPHALATHLHPIHWLSEHPLAVAILLTGLIALMVFWLTNQIGTGIKPETIRPFDYPLAFPGPIT